MSTVIYVNQKNGEFSFDPAPLERNGYEIDSRDFASAFRPAFYTFCLDVSDVCNLRCDYCFNANKTGRLLSPAEAFSFLDRMFLAFPNGEKYFVDMSGKGEPLLNLRAVLSVAGYCRRKSDEIRREVLPTFVCNGTLLSPAVAKALQSGGILFGVSLDGSKDSHDRHRRDAFGGPTYDTILANVLAIEHRDYVGCAVTITKDVFDLLNAVESLADVFPTVSIKPVRSLQLGLDDVSSKEWCDEYDKLAVRLIVDAKDGNGKLLFCLLNGDDYFGKFLYRCFLGVRTINRCDSGITRFTCDVSGRLYGCPALSANPDSVISNSNLGEVSKDELIRQSAECLGCPFKWFCGGECKVERLLHGGEINKAMCSFKRHLILLAMLVSLETLSSNQGFFVEVRGFCIEKSKRYKEDLALKAFLDENPALSFTEAKLAFDRANKRY